MEYTLKELEEWNVKIEKKATEFGLDYYPQEFEIVGFNEMLAYEAYVGMPSKYPHWSYGKAYEKNKTLYSLNLTGLPYEMVINSNPSLAYLMKENTLLLQILTMAHVYGHNDFFKNNRLFREGTKAYYTLEMFKLDADIIRSYINDPNIEEKGEAKYNETNEESDDGKISINDSDLSKLKEIPGIGDVKANAIILYREKNNGFKSIEELKNVDGIGEKTFEKIKDSIKL